jgi:hypothetical protein
MTRADKQYRLVVSPTFGLLQKRRHRCIIVCGMLRIKVNGTVGRIDGEPHVVIETLIHFWAEKRAVIVDLEPLVQLKLGRHKLWSSCFGARFPLPDSLNQDTEVQRPKHDKDTRFWMVVLETLHFGRRGA